MTEASIFLSTLFSQVSGTITVFTLPDACAKHFETSEEAAEYAEKSKSLDVYFGVATRKQGLNSYQVGTERELQVLPALWLDIDLPGPGHKRKLNFPPDAQSALAALSEKLLPPSAVVHSGGGLHVYHFLKAPLDVSTPQGVLDARRVLKAHHAKASEALAAHGWEMDDTTKVPGILRVPGTLNHKGSSANPVSILDLQSTLYPFSDLVSLSMSSEESPAAALAPAAVGTAASEDRLKEASNRKQIEDTLDKTPVSISDLREKLQHFVDKHKDSEDKKDSAHYVALLLAGEPVERAGNRDNTLSRLAAIVAMLAPWNTPESIAEEIFGKSLDAMANLSPDDPGPDRPRVAYMISRGQQNKQESLIDGLIASFDVENAARQKGDANCTATGKYSDQELDAFAKELGVSRSGLEKRWIIVHEGSYNIYVGGKYLPPVSAKDLDLNLKDDLSPAPVQHTKINEKGREIQRTPREMVMQYGTHVRTVKADLTIKKSWLDVKNDTFHEAVCALRPLEPQRNEHVEEWLSVLGGEREHKLLDWMAASTRLERQCAALYLSGKKGVGKNALARGVAQQWNLEGAPTDLEAILGNFNGDLVRCPLIFADEKIDAPHGKKITGELRKMIGSNTRPLMRKFLPNCSLVGAVRLILAANNDRMLELDHEDLGGDDLEAVASRFVHIHCDPRAAKILEDFRARGIVDDWFKTSAIAKHALWLRDTRVIVEGKRFIVEGDPSVMTNQLARQTKPAQLVLQWLVKYLTDPIPQPASLGLIKAGEGKLIVATTVFDDWWDKYVKSDKVPSTTRIGRVLSNWSSGKQAMLGRFRAHEIDVAHLIAWSEEHCVGSVERILARVNGPVDNLKDANVISLDLVRAEKEADKL